jgi:hypothetical protein
MASEDKFTAEAGASETKTILGWLVNYRTLMVHLPENKFVAWSNKLQLLIDSKSATAKQLDSNISTMIHVAEVLPQMHHFLNKLRCLLERARNRRSITVPDPCLDDC